MKKVLSILIVSVLLISSAMISSFAAGTENEKFDIPKANQAPVIDGKIDGDEWDNALVRTLTPDNVTNVSANDVTFQGATFRWMWDDAGLYLFAEVKEATKPDTVHAPNAGSYNSGDGIQVNVYTSDDFEGSAVEKIFFYSLIPAATDGKAYIGEHFVYGTGSAGADVPASEATIASVVSGSSYTIEAFIAKESWAKSNPAIVIAEGLTMPLANIVMDQDGAKQALFTDTAWFSGIKANKYTLTNAVAGHVEIAEVEAPAETEAPVTTTPTAPAPTTTAPQTNDTVVIFSALAGIALLAAYAAFKKIAVR